MPDLSVDDRNAVLDDAARILDEGGLVVFPTDTVYGLGFRLDHQLAKDKFVRLKKREPDKPVSRHVSTIDEILNGPYTLDFDQEEFIRVFLPGPVTVLVLDHKAQIQGLRCPANRTSVELLSRTTYPVGASSVNISGENPLSKGLLIDKIFGDSIDLRLMDDEEVPGCVSTIVDLTKTPFQIVRKGMDVERMKTFIRTRSL